MNSIRQLIKVDDAVQIYKRFRFMKGKGTTDAIFIVRQMQENFIVIQYVAFCYALLRAFAVEFILIDASYGRRME